MGILKRRTQPSGAPFMATSDEINDLWKEREQLKREVEKRDMVIDYLYRVSIMMHPSQLLMWAEKALEQGVSLENVRTDET